MYEWDDEDDVDLDEWADRGSDEPSRTGTVVVAVVLLVPFVYIFGGGAQALDALGGVGLLAVAAFFVVVALAYLLVRRWLRRRLVDDSFWSDRR